MRAAKIRNLRVVSLFFLALLVIPHSVQFEIGSQTSEYVFDSRLIDLDDAKIPVTDESIILNDNEIWRTSDTEPSHLLAEGIIDPVQVEQSGYTSTGNITAATDTKVNTEQSLDIDTTHDWVVSAAQVEVTNLERLYVVNGSFNEGSLGFTDNPNDTLIDYPLGWSAVSTSSDIDQTQQVSYEEGGSGRYVSVQNKGELTNSGQNWYTHFVNTSVLWTQAIDLSPYTNQFTLSFSFLYLQGPIVHSLEGNFSLQVFLDNKSIWRQDLPTLSERGIWFNTGDIHVDNTLLTPTSLFSIGLVIDDTFYTDSDEDYDDSDDVPDGIVNAQYITVLLDDVFLTSTIPPSCESVALQATVGGISFPLFGNSGNGFGSVENPSFWQESALSFSIASNTSISLDYNVFLLNHRFLNSTPTTNTIEDGVAYSITSDQNGNLEMFTYLGFIGAFENLTIRIYHSSDWQNFTVFDPFLIDVTFSCIETTALIEIPTSLLIDRLGWWKVTCNVYNYASSASVQRYDSGLTDWVDETIYHTDDQTRLSVSIASMVQIPILVDEVNFTWCLPNCTVWYESSTVSGALGSAISSPIGFGPTNATAGVWTATYFWTNNTEIAFGCIHFALHHQASLEVVFEDELDAVVGYPVTVVMRFYDNENGLSIINDGAIVTSTWAGGIVDFEADLVKNWWQADFNTDLVGAGNFDVIVNSSAPFFETVPEIITIKSQYLTELNTPAGPLAPLIFGRSHSFDFFYSQSIDGLGIDGASVELSEEGSEWVTVVDNGNGHYNLTLVPLGIRDYSIRISFSKIGYQNQTFVLSFLVEKVPMTVRLISGLSGEEHRLFEIEIAVEEVDTQIPVLGANVTLSVVTSAGTIYIIQTMDEQNNGHYTTSITMPPAELPGSSITYSLIIQVSKDNYELNEEFQDTLVPIVDPAARALEAIVEYSGPVIFVASGLIVAVVGQRVFARKSKRKRAAARAIEIRLKDANNLLGIIVLHKLSGVPIYSKILKGGFEEGMLSAFITAIMHFRAEFDAVQEHDMYHILPISDIIRAVPTGNLICAFITISSASREQEEKMIGYGRAVGMTLDDVLSHRPTQVVDAKTAKTLEWYFDDFVDGALVRDYQIGEKPLSGKFKNLDNALPDVASNGTFKLDRMIRALENCGLSEDDAYILVMDAIEKEIILPIYAFVKIIDSENGES